MTERAEQDLLPLYVRLYFDEDVSVDIVRNLRQRGFDALSTQEARRLQLDDDAQLAFAVQEQRALVITGGTLSCGTSAPLQRARPTLASSSPGAVPATLLWCPGCSAY